MKETLLPAECIQRCILFLRGNKVILDKDLAELYGVPTKVLKQAVKRNMQRFPADFMFVLDSKEVAHLRSQIVTSSWGGARHSAMAFTEQGVAMLSSVLNSEQAVRMNIAIIRVFVQLRRMLASQADLTRKLYQLEKKYDSQFRAVFDAIRQLMSPPAPKKKQIGFGVREKPAGYRK